jgi:endonuclease/exonuclease/phosphatase family metal-dependent hydrolase
VPRSYPTILVAILAAGGWYFSKNPGKLNDFINSIKQVQSSSGQYAPAGNYASPSYPTYPGQPPVAPTQATYNYNGPPAVQAAPATPPPTPMFGGPAIRIASFNIQTWGDEKEKKPYVMATIASIVQNFQIVAVQEIRTKDQYFVDNFLRTYVNQNGRKYNKVVGPRLGRTVSKEQYAFIYDTAAIEVNPACVFTVNDPEDLLHREPFVAQFRVRGPPEQQAFTFVLIDMHTDPDETKSELDTLEKVYQAVRRACPGEDDVILLGDLNVDDGHLGELGRISGIYPVVRRTYTNTRQNAQYDNIIFHGPSTTEFTGRWGVFNFAQQFGLNINQALEVSDHFPVWAEFNAYESTTPGRVAFRDGQLRVQ